MGSFGALVAGLAVVIADATWVDPVASLFIAGLITLSALVLLRDVGRVLLEGAPAGLHVDDVEARWPTAPWRPCTTCTCGHSGRRRPPLSAHVVHRGARCTRPRRGETS